MRYTSCLVPTCVVIAASVFFSTTAFATPVDMSVTIFRNGLGLVPITDWDGIVAPTGDLDPRPGFIFFYDTNADTWSVSGHLESRITNGSAKLILTDTNITDSGKDQMVPSNGFIFFDTQWSGSRTIDRGIGNALNYAGLGGLFKDVFSGPIDPSTHVKLETRALSTDFNPIPVLENFAPNIEYTPGPPFNSPPADPITARADGTFGKQRPIQSMITTSQGLHGKLSFTLAKNDGIELRSQDAGPLIGSPFSVNEDPIPSDPDSTVVMTFSVVPEPSTWVLLCTGFLSLLATGRRRRKRAA